MHKLSDNQYFLIIPQIKLFPELKTQTVAMIEQLMNAVLLSSADNIQTGINRIIDLEMRCKNLVKQDYLIVLNQLAPVLEQYDLDVVQGDTVRAMYIHYHDFKQHYTDVGKQAAMNLDFAKAKKISYNGRFSQVFIVSFRYIV